MGYIDSDAHLRETDDTWNYLDPAERDLRPQTLRNEENGTEWWVISNQRIVRRDRDSGLTQDEEAIYSRLYPSTGVHDLSDVPGRLRHLDQLGIDVQVLISSFWISAVFDRPLIEAALARSYNRWLAERTADSGGRLRWAMIAPLQMMNRALEELDFAKANGAAAVHIIEPQPLGLVVDDEYFHEFYAKAQDLDIPILVHVGLDARIAQRDVRGLFPMVTAVIAGFHRLASGQICEKFPRLRWAFLEAGASWLPFVLKEAARSTETLVRVEDSNGVVDSGLLSERNLYVACQIDDDLTYISDLAGSDNLVVGTDYTHFDVGSDVGACGIIANRTDIKPELAKKISDTNGRRLFGIDDDFTPSSRRPTSA